MTVPEDRMSPGPPQRSPAKKPQHNDSDASMASRIAASASGLSRELIGSAGNGDLAAATSGSGKASGATVSSGPSHWKEQLPSRIRGASAGNRYDDSGSLQPTKGFRNGFYSSAFQHEVPGELENFLDDRRLQSAPYEPPTFNGDWRTEFESSIASNGLAGPRTGKQVFSGGPVQSMGYDDGAEVSRLLSDPSFAADTMPSDPMEEDVTDEGVAGLFTHNFSPEEKQAEDRMRAPLPPPPVHQQMSPENPLNLRPNFDQQDLHISSPSPSGSWISDWEDVLCRYTDEVWGDMLPVVKQAREQLEKVKNDPARVDTSAVARLRMILGHVVQNADSTGITSGSVPGTGEAGLAYGLDKNGFDRFQASHSNGLQKEQYEAENLNQQQHDLAQAGSWGLLGQPQAYENRFGLPSLHAFNQMQQMQQERHQNFSENESAQMDLDQHHEHYQSHRQPSSSAQRNGINSQQDEETSHPPIFHCPWISCHERFNSLAELSLHSNAHESKACPHTGCQSRFSHLEEWKEHIQMAHHDILETKVTSESLWDDDTQ
ncbi:hypothetical protein BDY21DRAFT_336744 [Lineolata rhizophorae]|uniref:C2H2-type domain-containing protein n=1 Tax=Lineolata rhizophorae TaxID=578093 RepID=A0A6A6P8U9_9PEZI|nr:hypothetical protein BDY21DRAFT_336744 [Lineolata rhizophorae]